MEKKCFFCNISFETSNLLKKYCSMVCKRKFERIKYKDKIKIDNKLWKEKNVEHLKKYHQNYSKEYYSVNKLNLLEYQKEYRENNRLKINERSRKYRNTPEIKLKLKSNSKKYRFKHNLANKNYYYNNKLQIKCRYLFNYKKNKLKLKKFCEICDLKDNIEYHHENYNEPYKVIALCKNCHTLRHYVISNFESIDIVTKCKDLYNLKFMNI